jgi:predicted nuclease with TOPRIM domain
VNATMVFISGIVGLCVTIIGAVVAVRKLGPEINKIQVDTSESLVAMARENAEMHRTDAAELRQRNEALDNRLTEYVEKLGRAMADIEELKTKAANVERLTAENARLRRERNAALNEVTELKGRVKTLEERIQEIDAQVE